jgi:hypothetical protein
VQDFRVGLAHGFETMLEFLEQAAEPAGLRLFTVPLVLEQEAYGDRRERAR